MQPWRGPPQPSSYEWLVEQARRCDEIADRLLERYLAVREAAALLRQAGETLASAGIGNVDYSAPQQRWLPALPAATAATSIDVAAAASPRSNETPEVPSPGASSSGPPLGAAPAATSAAHAAAFSAASAVPAAAPAPSAAASRRRERNSSESRPTEVRRSKRLREASLVIKSEEPTKREPE